MTAHSWRIGPVLVAAAVLTSSIAATTPATASSLTTSERHSASPTAGAAYVALGDSYAAGYGLVPSTGLPVPGCGQSGSDYPHQVAQALDLKLTDVTCTGAATANLISTPQATAHGKARPQSAALSADTKVVTVTIGGNDLGFFSIASSCVAASATGPLIAEPKRADCKKEFVVGGIDSLKKKIAGAVTSGTSRNPSGLTAAFATITKAAPNAKVFVIGYPTVMPDAANTPAGGCFRPAVKVSADFGDQGFSVTPHYQKNSFPFTNADVRYLNAVEEGLDAAVGTAARKAGFHYISVLAASAQHSACATPSTAYVNGITVRSIGQDLSIDLVPGALHPNAAGAAFLSNEITPVITKAFATAPTARPQPNETPGAAGDQQLWLWIVGSLAAAVLLAAVLVVIVRRRRRR